MTKVEVVFLNTEKVRRFSTKDGDKNLCRQHATARHEEGQKLGVPSDALAFMMGMKPWPTGQEPCDDC